MSAEMSCLLTGCLHGFIYCPAYCNILVTDKNVDKDISGETERQGLNELNCIYTSGWQFHVDITQPSGCSHPDKATYFYSIYSNLAFKTFFSLQSISTLYMQRERERVAWLLNKDFWTKNVPGRYHHLFIGLSLNSFIWTVVPCAIYSGRQISKCKEMDRVAKIFSISLPTEHSCCMVAKYQIMKVQS